MEGIQIVTQDFVNVHITKSDKDDTAPVERRFKKDITIQDFKVNYDDSHIFLLNPIKY